MKRKARSTFDRMLSYGLTAMIMVGCSQSEGCGCGEVAEYPSTGLEVDQGLQVRLSEQGVTTLEAAVLPLISEQLGGGGGGGSSISFCIPETRGDQDICFDGETCDDGSRGCQLTLQIESIDIRPVDNGAGTVTESDAGNPDALEVEVRINDFIIAGNKVDNNGNPDGTYDAMSLAAFGFPWIGTACRADIGLDQENGVNKSIGFSLALNLLIDSSNEDKLALQQGGAELLDSNNLSIGLSGGFGSGCNLAGALVGLAEGLILGQIEGLFTPQITTALDGFLCTQCEAGCDVGSSCDTDRNVCVYDGTDQCVPAPFGAEGKFNAAEMLGDFLTGVDAEVYYSIWPATYADAVTNGISLGIRTGATADHNTCVPYQDPPSDAPVPRSAQLEAATSPNGSTFDAGIGISESFLEHVMWSVYTSGTLCIEIGSKDIPQLSSSALALFMQSINTLTNGEGRPALIQLFPKQAPTVKIGAGTFKENPNTGALELDDPLLIIELFNLDINFYIYAFDRYTRIFTVNTDIELPLGLTLTPQNELLPIAGDLATGIKRLEVRNSEILSEDPAVLEGLLPSLLAGFLPSLTDGLSQPIALPDLMGFSLSVEEMTGIENNTLIGLFAGLDYIPPGGLGLATDTTAHISNVEVPAARYTNPQGALVWSSLDRPMHEIYPRVTLQLGGTLPVGYAGELEYSYSVDDGLWSPFTTATQVVVQHPALLLQGRHTVDVRSRVKGNYRTLDPLPERLELVVDWTRPVIEDVGYDGEGTLAVIDAVDAFTPREHLLYRHRVERGAWSAWTDIPTVELAAFAGTRVDLDVEVQDSSGNIARSHRGVSVSGTGGGLTDSESPQASNEATFGCSVSPTSQGGDLPLGGALFLLMGAALFGIRRRRSHLGVALLLVAIALLGMACDDDAANQQIAKCDPACADSEACVAGTCVPTCASDSDCLEGQICADSDGDGKNTCEYVSCADVSECGGVSCSGGNIAKCFQGNCICEAPCNNACGDDQFCCNTTDSCEALPDACAGLSCDPGFAPEVQDPATGDPNSCTTTDGTCDCVELPPLDFGRAGEYASIDAGGGVLAVSALNRTYRDLIVGVGAPGSADITWHFVDGVPSGAPIEGSVNGPRDGIKEKGPKVGDYTSVAVSDSGVIHVSYHDMDNDTLLYARGESDGSGGYAWSKHTVDETGSTGYWTSITLDASGAPGIAYVTLDVDEGSGSVSQLRYARAASATPGAATDWTLSTLDSASTDNPNANPEVLVSDWPYAVAVFTSSARYSDGRLAVAYFDATGGNLKLVTEDSSGFTAPQILDGEAPDGTDTGLMGLYPSIAIDGSDGEHIAYMDWTHKDLVYIDVQGAVGSVVDGGQRQDPFGPSFNYVGSGTALDFNAAGEPVISYMDATMHQIVSAHRRSDGVWSVDVVEGDGRDGSYSGAYGFYVDHIISGGQSHIASLLINQQANPLVFAPELTLFTLP